MQRPFAWTAVLLGAAGSLFAALLFLSPPQRAATDLFRAGIAGDLAPASVTYFQERHIYLVRLTSGEFLAFSDIDPRARSTDANPLSCQIHWYPLEFANVGRIDSEDRTLAGLENGRFREPCFQSTYDASGRRLFGPSPRNLDQYRVDVHADGTIWVDLAQRLRGQSP